MNSKTSAWRRLTEITGQCQQGIDYRRATTISINTRIATLESEDRNRRGREMYNRSISQRLNAPIIKVKKVKTLEPVASKKIIFDNCSICLCKLTSEDLITLGCDHSFHQHCIRELLFLHMKDKCPLCRREYVYNLKACKKVKYRLRKKIIKYHSDEKGFMDTHELLRLAFFLLHKNITLQWLHAFMMMIVKLDLDILDDAKYCILNDSQVSFYTNNNLSSHSMTISKQNPFTTYCGCI